MSRSKAMREISNRLTPFVCAKEGCTNRTKFEGGLCHKCFFFKKHEEGGHILNLRDKIRNRRLERRAQYLETQRRYYFVQVKHGDFKKRKRSI